jgi:hypothetical protein
MRLKLAVAASAMAVTIVMMGSAHAGEAVKSGLTVGKIVGAFEVDDVTGPHKGQTLCYR